jgi:ABC-type Fe3+-hydroxamate transport system substrate-binding protein
MSTAPAGPRRIVSLVPSLTESLFLLGVGDRVVGRTEYCVEPAGRVESVPTVGGTKSADVDAIAALSPDLVLVNQEENTPAIHRDLVALGVPVHLSFPKTVADAVALLHELAALLDVAADHPALARLDAAVAAMERLRANTTPRKVFCPIWMDPLMTIHGDTFISDVLDLCGGQNVFLDRPRRYPLAADLGRAAAWDEQRVGLRDTRYPRVTLDEVVDRQPEVVLLPDEPHPFTEADAAVFRALDVPAAKQGRVLRVDGKALCWYSPRLADALPEVRAWLHP